VDWKKEKKDKDEKRNEREGRQDIANLMQVSWVSRKFLTMIQTLVF